MRNDDNFTKMRPQKKKNRVCSMHYWNLTFNGSEYSGVIHSMNRGRVKGSVFLCIINKYSRILRCYKILKGIFEF